MLLLHDLIFSMDSLFYWGIYAFVCFFFCLLMVYILPPRLRRQPRICFIFFFSLSLSITGFGPIIALIIATGLRFKKSPVRKPNSYRSIEYPAFQQAPVNKHIGFGEASGFELIQDPNSSKEKRKEILIAVNQAGMNNANRINSIALSDDIDEVRLYAQGLIEKKERKLSMEINELDETLLTIKNIKHEAYCKKQIAEVLWEQIYQLLVGKETIKATLEKIKTYATEAFEILDKDMELPVLLAKIAIKESAFDEAKTWLCKAATNQVPQYKVSGLLAEIDYIEKNYNDIKSRMIKCINPGIIGLQPAALFWTAYD